MTISKLDIAPWNEIWLQSCSNKHLFWASSLRYKAFQCRWTSYAFKKLRTYCLSSYNKVVYIFCFNLGKPLSHYYITAVVFQFNGFCLEFFANGLFYSSTSIWWAEFYNCLTDILRCQVGNAVVELAISWDFNAFLMEYFPQCFSSTLRSLFVGSDLELHLTKLIILHCYLFFNFILILFLLFATVW